MADYSEYALYATSQANGEYLTIKVRVMGIEDGTPRNVRTNDDYCHEPFAGITISAQSDRSEPIAYAIRFGIDSDGVMPTANVERTLVTLRRVQRALDRYYARFGPTQSFGQYVARIADAMNLPILTGELDSRGYRLSTYADGVYARWTSGDIASVIDGWTAKHAKPAAA